MSKCRICAHHDFAPYPFICNICDGTDMFIEKKEEEE